MRFTKLDLLESFDRLDKSYRLSILCSYWIRDVPCFQPNAAGLALETEMKAGNDWIKFDDLGISLQTRATAESLSAELMLNQLHTLIRISFELLVDYCKCYDKLYPTQQNDLQFAKMRQMDWFNFAKIVRNIA